MKPFIGSGISTWNNQFQYDRISRLKLEDFDGKSCAFVFDRLRSERLIEVGGDIDHIKQTNDGALINGRWEFDHLKTKNPHYPGVVSGGRGMSLLLLYGY